MRQGSLQCLDVCRSSQLPSRKDLNHIGPGVPGSQDLCGRHSARDDQGAVTMSELDEVEIERRAHDELGPGEQCSPPRLRIQNGSGAHDDFISVFTAQFCDHIDGSLNAHRDLDEANPALLDRICNVDGLRSRGHPDHGNQPFRHNLIEDLPLLHLVPLLP